MKKIKYYKGDKKKMKEKFTKIIPIMVLCVMLSVPVVSNAASASISLTMSDSSKSAKVTCAAAEIKGGALTGGAGIKYYIYDKSTTAITYDTVKSGSCASGVSYSYVYSSSTGYSKTLKVKLKQKDSSNPGIGWTRINY